VDFAEYVGAVNEIGPEHFIMSTDSGLPTRPLHTDAMAMFRRRMRDAGISSAAVDLMTKTNPARLLGLP
jgi:predicted TIM-barrel fold metal-dependent hydrolase